MIRLIVQIHEFVYHGPLFLAGILCFPGSQILLQGHHFRSRAILVHCGYPGAAKAQTLVQVALRDRRVRIQDLLPILLRLLELLRRHEAEWIDV